MCQHININNILATQQYGFKNNSSNEKASYKLINEILLALNNKLTVGGIFCDLEEAFGYVNNDILLYKCGFYGFRSKTYALLQSYLSQRYQRKQMNNSFLIILGHLFFLIYINDLLNIIADPWKPILFADDTSIIITNPSPSKFKEHINNISDTINEWHNFLWQFCIQL